MKWVTWEQVGVDRMACAWLITKYIDPQAEFLFVPAGKIPLPEGAEPFDIPGVRLYLLKKRGIFKTTVSRQGEYRFTPEQIAEIEFNFAALKPYLKA